MRNVCVSGLLVLHSPQCRRDASKRVHTVAAEKSYNSAFSHLPSTLQVNQWCQSEYASSLASTVLVSGKPGSGFFIRPIRSSGRTPIRTNSYLEHGCCRASHRPGCALRPSRVLMLDRINGYPRGGRGRTERPNNSNKSPPPPGQCPVGARFSGCSLDPPRAGQSTQQRWQSLLPQTHFFSFSFLFGVFYQSDSPQPATSSNRIQSPFSIYQHQASNG